MIIQMRNDHITALTVCGVQVRLSSEPPGHEAFADFYRKLGSEPKVGQIVM